MKKSRMLPCTRRKETINLVRYLLLIFLILTPASLLAQVANPLTTDKNARYSASLSASYQFKSNLDGGGDASIAHYGVAVGNEKSLGDNIGLGVRLNYEREEYNFSNTYSYLVPKPWGQINRVGLSMRLGYKLTDQWSLGGGPVVQYAGENGAGFSEALIYGGIVSAVYRANPDLTIGFGAGVFYRLEQTRVFPSLIASWRITNRLRLENSYRLGATGPAGLELSYKVDENWEIAVGGGRRLARFRLDKDGFTPGGIGENSNWPVYARLSRKLGSALYLDLFGGAAFGGQMKLQDSKGNDIQSIDYQTTTFLGCNLRAGF